MRFYSVDIFYALNSAAVLVFVHCITEGFFITFLNRFFMESGGNLVLIAKNSSRTGKGTVLL